jgi:hypothetical protein
MLNELKDTVSVTVGRGPQSMAFFAFIFSALFTLFNTVFNDYGDLPWLNERRRTRPLIKVSVFCLLFVFVMKNAWFHNWLVGVVLRWLTTETYPPMT